MRTAGWPNVLLGGCFSSQGRWQLFSSFGLVWCINYAGGKLRQKTSISCFNSSPHFAFPLLGDCSVSTATSYFSQLCFLFPSVLLWHFSWIFFSRLFCFTLHFTSAAQCHSERHCIFCLTVHVTPAKPIGSLTSASSVSAVTLCLFLS